MSSRRDSHDPHPGPEHRPGVILVCQSCDHTWEPSLADLAAGPVPCTHCDGWTMIGEIVEPDPAATSRPQRGGGVFIGVLGHQFSDSAPP